ncbi:hypothetical protein C8R44DRAFT_758240, partial [Mycena epipterygia]
MLVLVSRMFILGFAPAQRGFYFVNHPTFSQSCVHTQRALAWLEEFVEHTERAAAELAQFAEETDSINPPPADQLRLQVSYAINHEMRDYLARHDDKSAIIAYLSV